MKILFTKFYPDTILKKQFPNTTIESIDFIKTHFVPFDTVEGLLNKETNFIVSSKKSAQYAVKEKINGTYFCIGKTSAKHLAPHFSVKEIAPDASTLASRIIEKYPHESFCYLCSNIRLPTLPDRLAQHTITLKEIVVYHTKEYPVMLSNSFDAYVFLSPSGVKSFFKNHKIPKNSLIFAIGKTTQASVQCFTNQICFVPKMPDIEHLIYLIKEKINA